MAVNGDEGEPGTFKDRYFLETDPHRFLEGMLIAAWVVEAADIYIYLRDEYPQCRAILGQRDRRDRGGRAGAAHAYPSAARRRRLYLRRGIGDARKHRGQARTAAPQAAVSVAGRALRPADPDQQCRDPLLGARHRREGAGMVHRPGPQRAQGAAHLLGVGAGQETPASSSPRPGSPRAS